MQDLTERPLVCVTLAFAAGIAMAAAMGYVSVWVGAAVIVLAVACRAWPRWQGWRGVVALGAAVGVGGGAFLAVGVHGATDVAALRPGGQTLVGTVAGAPRYSDGVWRFVLAVERHESGESGEPVGGWAYVRLRSPSPVARGERWRLTGRLRTPRGEDNPGERSEAARLASLGVSAVLTVGAAELAERLGAGSLTPVSAHAFAAQQRALSLLERHVSGPYRELSAGVAASVIFGVHATAPPAEISDIFRRAGTIHLLVVSGAMVSMVFGFVFLPGALGAEWRRLQHERQVGWPADGKGAIRRWPGVTAAVLAVVAVSYYAVLTEGGQAVARAAIMGGLVGLALVLRRVPAVARAHGLNLDRYTLLAAAALGILAANPKALFQGGFQLSFAAVWAIIFLTPKVTRLMGFLPRWLELAVVGTVVAQLATFPILVWHYGQAPLGGLGANLVAVPLAAVVLTAGMATCGLGLAAPWLASAPGWVTGVCSRWMVWVSSVFASIPAASPEVAQPSWAAIIAWYGGMVALGWWLGRRGGAARAGDRRLAERSSGKNP